MTGVARWSRGVTRIVVALAIAALLPMPSLADEPQLEAVAVRALRWAFYASNGYRWEYSGILVIHDGQLRYSASPNTLKKVDAVEMDVEKQRIPGDILVGLYHTHPCNTEEYFPQYFSPQDLVSAFFWHVPTFILDECTGEVHEFDPLRDRAADTGTVVRVIRKDGTRTWVRLPAGRVVGNIGDQGPDLSLIEQLMSETTQ
jgi:proteasome lid subunit RPN8/RPN11